MTSSLITALRRNRIYLLFVVVLACDSFDGDRIEPKKQVTFSQTEYFTIPGSSIVIDLKTSIKQAFASVSLRVLENPQRGVLTQIDSFLFKYTPGDFVERQDQFSLSGTLDDGSIVKSEPLVIYVKESVEEFPCGVHAVEDYVRSTTTDATVIQILNNDRICPGPEVDVFIRLAPKLGDAQVIGDSIVYKPYSSIEEGDELVYGIRSADGEVVSYGLVSLNKMMVEIIKVPIEMSEIFFVDDEIGFMAGEGSIYKTTDGGTHWEELQYPGRGVDLFMDFTHIFFVDENKGFVSFSECEWFGPGTCLGGWLMTSDGGLSWKRIDFGVPVNSIVFASPLVGFMATSTLNDLEQMVVSAAIFRTVDGGNTWEQALSTSPYFGDFNISLANERVGFVFEPRSIYGTKDGGTTWMFIAPDEYVTSLAVAGEDVVCASFSSTFSQTMPGTISRSEGGSHFTPVSDYTHSIVALKFSQSGDLGIALGIKGQPIYPGSEPLMISRSTDKGRTWTELPLLIHGDPQEISIPSENVAYILCSGRIIKYTN